LRRAGTFEDSEGVGSACHRCELLPVGSRPVLRRPGMGPW
jgi:hypothetical protein